MTKFPGRETVDSLRREYPKGTMVVLEYMEDLQAPPVGTLGTVTGVDDAGSLLIQWDNGSSLSVAYGEDRVTKMIMDEKVFEQLMAIRDSGESNMFDLNRVQRLAYDRGYYELVCYIEDYEKEYAHFIMTGREE